MSLRGLLLTALLAGLLAGLAFFTVQSVTTRPLIAQAEVLEHAAAAPHDHAAHDHAGHQPAPVPAWEPAEGTERAAYTLAADGLIGVGYAFLLVGALSLSGCRVGPGSGLIWGAAGFLAFVAAPALGLPPEPPGAAGADLLTRQVWWLGTAVATAAGLWLILLRPGRLLPLLGAALLLAPHLIGAPHAVEAPTTDPADAELARQFVRASLAANAALWATLGLAVGSLYPRFNGEAAAPPLRARA